jgi:hypothetical protein
MLTKVGEARVKKARGAPSGNCAFSGARVLGGRDEGGVAATSYSASATVGRGAGAIGSELSRDCPVAARQARTAQSFVCTSRVIPVTATRRKQAPHELQSMTPAQGLTTTRFTRSWLAYDAMPCKRP